MEDMKLIMNGELDDKDFVKRGHVSHDEDLRNREKNHVAKKLRKVSLGIRADAIMHNPAHDEDKAASSTGQAADEPHRSPILRELGVGSTVLTRRVAAAMSIQKVVRGWEGRKHIASKDKP